MRRMLAAETAVLLGFKLIRMLLFVLIRRIVSMLAYRTFEIDYFAHLIFVFFVVLLLC